MPRAEFDLETSLSPERVRAALLDFTDRRPELWPAIDPSLYEVYSVSETEADVKEGSVIPGMTVWAREHYEFSDPRTVSWRAAESNFCTPGSGVTVTLDPRPAGGTRMHVAWERTGTSLRSRFVIRLISLTKGRPIASGLRKALARIEQLDAGTR